MPTRRAAPGHYLIASEFDHSLSFTDSRLYLASISDEVRDIIPAHLG